TEKLFFDNGFQDFLSKPIDIMRLDAVLKKWVKVSKSGESKPLTDSESEHADVDIHIPGLDAAKALRSFGGGMDVFVASMRSFVTHTPKLLDELQRVTADTISESGVINAHGLKGSSSNIRAEHLRAAAASMEAAARAGNFAKFSNQLVPIIKTTKELITDISAWLYAHSEQNGKPHQAAPDDALLAKLRTCCENYDMSGIDDVMDALEEHDYDTDGNLVEWLREKVDMMELDEVIERLK
ncbi:MAG: hypothetical protein FWG45_07535, partial [Oscillospiraceae bacterium]|nr:hypothetical protein [Oscillospiraceae bacterium]